MRAAEFKDAKLLWKMFYAYHCFRRAEAAAQHILDERLEKESALFYPLVTSVYVLYGKPFKRARGVGQLGEELIPPEHLDLHRQLLEHRDQIYAHIDADAFPLADYGGVNQLRVIQAGTEQRLFAVDFHARFPLMPSVIDLCRVLQTKTWYHVEKLFNRYKSKVPESAGEYVINVSNEAGEFFTRAKPMIS
jgi:hypothetical protein